LGSTNLILVSLQSVCRTFGAGRSTRTALDNINLEIRSGEFIVVVGPSGCGKTTLLGILAGLEQPSSGLASFEGFKDLTPSEFRQKGVAMVFQFDTLLPHLTLKENVELAMVFAGKSLSESRARSGVILRFLRISDRGNSFPWELSGGEAQRGQVARAIANHPRLLIADEPTAHLDSENAMKVVDALLRLWRKRALTIVLATHDVDLITPEMKVVELIDGKIAGVRDPAP